MIPLIEDKKEVKIKTGYEHLLEMIRIKNVYSTFSPQLNPMTNRFMYVLKELNAMGIKYQVDIFGRDSSTYFSYYDTKLMNVVVEFGQELKEQPAVVFTSHVDVVNIHSENVQDNTASVCNLLHLCEILSKKEIHTQRVIILFNDAEEHGGKGANYFSKQIEKEFYGEIAQIITLELTGLGNKVWCDFDNFKASDEFIQTIEDVLEIDLTPVSTPFSDAYIFRRAGFRNSFCIGILPEDELMSGYPKTWALCHNIADTIEKANGDDMNNFVNILLKFTNKKETIIAL